MPLPCSRAAAQRASARTLASGTGNSGMSRGSGARQPNAAKVSAAGSALVCQLAGCLGARVVTGDTEGGARPSWSAAAVGKSVQRGDGADRPRGDEPHEEQAVALAIAVTAAAAAAAAAAAEAATGLTDSPTRTVVSRGVLKHGEEFPRGAFVVGHSATAIAAGKAWDRMPGNAEVGGARTGE